LTSNFFFRLPLTRTKNKSTEQVLGKGSQSLEGIDLDTKQVHDVFVMDKEHYE